MTVPLYSGRFAAELIFFIRSSPPPRAQPFFSAADTQKILCGFFPAEPRPTAQRSHPPTGPRPKGEENQDGDSLIHSYPELDNCGPITIIIYSASSSLPANTHTSSFFPNHQAFSFSRDLLLGIRSMRATGPGIRTILPIRIKAVEGLGVVLVALVHSSGSQLDERTLPLTHVALHQLLLERAASRAEAPAAVHVR